MVTGRGDWVSQSVKGLVLDFGSGHDLTAGRTELHVELCNDSAKPA